MPILVPMMMEFTRGELEIILARLLGERHPVASKSIEDISQRLRSTIEQLESSPVPFVRVAMNTAAPPAPNDASIFTSEEWEILGGIIINKMFDLRFRKGDIGSPLERIDWGYYRAKIEGAIQRTRAAEPPAPERAPGFYKVRLKDTGEWIVAAWSKDGKWAVPVWQNRAPQYLTEFSEIGERIEL